MMKKGLFLAMLMAVAAFTAAIGTGAIDVFSAKRSSAMTIATDSNALVAISGDDLYAKEASNGTLNLDFTNTSSHGKGFNPQSNSTFNDVFTVTNRSEKTIYVWLEAEGWNSQHNAGLVYRVSQINNNVVNAKYTSNYASNNPVLRDLLNSTGRNFDKGIGKNAYVALTPGESFDVSIYVNSVLGNGYGSAGFSWSHAVVVKANSTPPVQN